MQIENGFIDCNIQSTGTKNNTGTTTVYNDQQRHSWLWTNSPPFTIPNQMPNHDNMSVTWSVRGSGSTTTTDNSNGKILSRARWTTGGSLMKMFRIWQDNSGNINVTSRQQSITNPGYSVTQDVVGGIVQTNPSAQSFTVSEPPLPPPQTLFFKDPPGFPLGRGSFLLYGLPFEIRSIMGKLVFSSDPSYYGTTQQQMFTRSGWAPAAFVTSSATWIWRIFV